MLNLIAISYKNIGPFQDKTLSIFLNSGKILIRAPIGTGKSFLFFDGPIYGLYKYSSRHILNTKSKEGFIKLIIEVNGVQYFIIRNIKKSKVKESCESKVYELEGNMPNFEIYAPLEQNIDIEDIIKQQTGLKRNEIIFKNETDLQQNLQGFLPPKEVIMNTIFLMQDSENIFELTPIERLTILKNVFNLLGIDEAKDVLADKKREIRYKIKSKTDLSSYDKKLQNNIQNYLSIFGATKQLAGKPIDIKPYNIFFDERKMIGEKVTINEFSLKDFPIEWEEKLQEYVEKEKTIAQKLQHQLETTQEHIKNGQKKLKEVQSEINELTKNINELKKKIANIDEKKIESIKKQKKEIFGQLEGYENKLPKTTIWKFMKNKESNHIKEESDINITNTYLDIQDFINKGKILNEKLQHIKAQIQNEELLAKNEAEKIKTQKKYLEEKISTQEDQLKKVKKILSDIKSNIEAKAKFECEKIKTNCPFIKIINAKNFEQLESQKTTIVDQQIQIEATIKKLVAELESLKKTEVKQDTKKTEALQKEQKDAETSIEAIKSFLNEIEYKIIEKLYNDYTADEKELKNLDQQISFMEQESKKIEERKLQVQKIITQKETIEKQTKEIVKIITEKEQEQKKIEIKKEESNYETIIQIEKNHLSMKQIHHNIQTLIDDFKEHKIETQKLQEQETILGNLYNIISKELLLLVLQDHLPVLNDIINSYLAQIVEYQISLQLRNESDKLELEAKILDQKGERETKSLSGGQRIILKLIRMLAISSYINSPILFLDETINNLDADTVDKVANMLEDFVKKREIKFYTITHSQQIQQMDIWDNIIEL